MSLFDHIYAHILTNLIDLVSMTTLEHAPHVTRRKGYAPHYIPQNMALFQPEMHDFTLELVNVRTTLLS